MNLGDDNHCDHNFLSFSSPIPSIRWIHAFAWESPILSPALPCFPSLPRVSRTDGAMVLDARLQVVQLYTLRKEAELRSSLHPSTSKTRPRHAPDTSLRSPSSLRSRRRRHETRAHRRERRCHWRRGSLGFGGSLLRGTSPLQQAVS